MATKLKISSDESAQDLSRTLVINWHYGGSKAQWRQWAVAGPTFFRCVFFLFSARSGILYSEFFLFLLFPGDCLLMVGPCSLWL